MSDEWWAVLAGLLGVVAGAAGTWAWVRARGTRPRTSSAAPPEEAGGVTAVLDVLRSAAVVAGEDGVVLRANTAAQAFGLVREDRIVHSALEALVLRAATGDAVLDDEIEVPRGPMSGAAGLVLRVRAARLDDHHVLLLAEDRTEARRVEAIRRDFVVNVSHELKTPVGALSLLAETVEDAADDPEAVRRFAQRMRTESLRLSALVQEIIQLSRLQDTDPFGSASPVDVGEVVAEAVDRARVAAAAKEIALDVGPQPEVTVYGDHDLLVTAVRNLLDNAIAYSDPRTRVAVGTTVRSGAGVVEVVVVDQGIGIPADALPRLFERFYRVDPARSRDTGGTGLGLSIVKHVAADHGGEVTVWSQPGQGSTFTVRLPLAREETGAVGPPPAPTREPGPVRPGGAPRAGAEDGPRRGTFTARRSAWGRNRTGRAEGRPDATASAEGAAR